MIKPFTDAMRDSIIQMLNYTLFFIRIKSIRILRLKIAKI